MSGKLSQPWLDKADADLGLGRVALAAGYIEHTCFLMQQCMEKALKGYLLDKTGAYPRTHTLIQLLAECIRLDATFASFRADCLIVDRYYIPTRYPDSTPPSSLQQSDALRAMTAANSLLQFVKNRL